MYLVEQNEMNNCQIEAWLLNAPRVPSITQITTHKSEKSLIDPDQLSMDSLRAYGSLKKHWNKSVSKCKRKFLLYGLWKLKDDAGIPCNYPPTPQKIVESIDFYFLKDFCCAPFYSLLQNGSIDPGIYLAGGADTIKTDSLKQNYSKD